METQDGDPLGRALRAHAGDAPHAEDLAGAVRRRARARRTWLTAAAAAAVGTVAIGTFAATGQLGPGRDPGPAMARGRVVPPSTLPPQTLSRDWRWESYGGVEVSVPAGWTRYGVSGAPWCVGGQHTGEIGRPGPVEAMPCPWPISPGKLGEHVWLTTVVGGPGKPRTEQLGDGWVRDRITVGHVELEVQTHRHPAVRRHILDSARLIDTVDASGCPVTHQASEPGVVRPQQGLGWDERVTGLAACRYAIQLDRSVVPGLVASVRFDEARATAILDAIRRAPEGAGPDAPGTVTADLKYGEEATVLRFGTADGVREVWVRYGGSELNGFDNGSSRHRLTREALAFMTGPLARFTGNAPTARLFPEPR